MHLNKSKSLASLDALNLVLMNIYSGIRPYLVVYLSSALCWGPVHIGFVMALSGFVGIIVQTPAGALIDATPYKRAWIVAGAIVIALCSLATVMFPDHVSVNISQSIAAAAGTVFAPAVAAISLGIVGREAMDERIGRNQSLSATGNVIIALLIGGVTHFLGTHWIYYIVALMAVAVVASTVGIRESDIDHTLAKGGEDPSQMSQNTLFNRTVVIFLASIVLFHFANGAMLPMVGQMLSKADPKHSCTYLSACIVVAQLFTIPLGLWIGRLSCRFSRKKVFLIAFLVLPIRGFLYSLSTEPMFLISLQILDAVCSTTAGIMQIMIATDLTKGTGKFNLMQGIASTALGLGMALSNLASGYLVHYIGFAKAFLVFAGIAVIALLFFYFMMPETKEEEEDNELVFAA